LSIDPQKASAFYASLQQEMQRFRLGLVLKLCSRRGYRITADECAALVDKNSLSLSQVLVQAKALDRERAGIIAAVKHFFSRKDKQWL